MPNHNTALNNLTGVKEIASHLMLAFFNRMRTAALPNSERERVAEANYRSEAGTETPVKPDLKILHRSSDSCINRDCILQDLPHSQQRCQDHHPPSHLCANMTGSTRKPRTSTMKRNTLRHERQLSRACGIQRKSPTDTQRSE